MPIDLTEGQATRDFAQQQFERETAKDAKAGAPLRERAAEQNERMRQNLDALVDLTGAEAPTSEAAGSRIVDALAKKAGEAKQKIQAAYDEARDAGDMAEPVPYQRIRDYIDEQSPTTREQLAPIIKMVDEQLAKSDPDGTGTVPISALEDIRQAIRKNTQYGTPNSVHGGELIQRIDQATEGAGGDLYQSARKMYADYAAEFKNRAVVADLLGTKKGGADRKVALENVVSRAVRGGSLDDLNFLKRSLLDAGEDGRQAWRELQGQTISDIRDAALQNVGRDERGNPIVSAAALNKRIGALDSSGKLEVIFGSRGAEHLRDLNDIAKDVFTAPPGSVNTSNTASALLNALSTRIGHGFGIPSIAMMGIKKLREVHASAKMAKQVEAALGPRSAEPAPRANPFETQAAAGETKAAIGETPGAAAGTNPAAGETPDVPREVDPRLQEIARLQAAHAGSAETVRVLDAQEKRINAEIRAGRSAQRRETEADALERAAASTFEPAVRQSLLARANELRGSRLPVGQATELQQVPTAKPEAIGKIPVGEAKELPPETGIAAPAKPLPAGQAQELTPEQAAQAKPSRRERELLRLRDEAADPEVLKDLDREIAAERKRGADAQRGREYLRLADTAQDPELRERFEAKARKLGAEREAIPAGEATEVAVADAQALAPDVLAALADFPPAEMARWAREHGFGALDAQAARDIIEARRYDADAVDRAAQQHARSPVAFGREIGRILEEGKNRASETGRPAGGSKGSGGPGPGPRGPQEGGGSGGSPVDAGAGRPRAPGGPGGGAGEARPGGSEEVAAPARAQAKARAEFEEATRPTGNPITDRLSARLRRDYEGAVREYATLPDSRGGVVLNTDVARELSPDYLADRTRSADVHEPSSAFIKRMYADRLGAPTPEGRQRRVMFTAGGTGAGKTTAERAMGDHLGKPEIVYDTNMNRLGSSVEKIDQALAAGRDVRVFYVYADPVDAFRQAISRTLSQKAKFGSGRTVPIEEHIKTHVGASRVIRELADRYRNDLRVDFMAADNSHGRGKARPAEIADLPLVSENGLREALEGIARSEEHNV